MPRINRLSVLFLAVLLAFCAACASSRSTKTYTREEARRVQTVETGKVVRVEPVRIEGTKTPLGVVAGGALGAALGSTIGRGTGQVIAGVAGDIAGGVAGGAVEEAATKKDGLEITVRLDSGRTVVVVQEADVAFGPGDRVALIKGPDGVTRVRHENTGPGSGDERLFHDPADAVPSQ
ncbi:MAG: hypothetical protein ACLFUL_17670 [Desulfobacteraceae bacterium]